VNVSPATANGKSIINDPTSSLAVPKPAIAPIFSTSCLTPPPNEANPISKSDSPLALCDSNNVGAPKSRSL